LFFINKNAFRLHNIASQRSFNPPTFRSDVFPSAILSMSAPQDPLTAALTLVGQQLVVPARAALIDIERHEEALAMRDIQQWLDQFAQAVPQDSTHLWIIECYALTENLYEAKTLRPGYTLNNLWRLLHAWYSEQAQRDSRLASNALPTRHEGLKVFQRAQQGHADPEGRGARWLAQWHAHLLSQWPELYQQHLAWMDEQWQRLLKTDAGFSANTGFNPNVDLPEITAAEVCKVLAFKYFRWSPQHPETRMAAMAPHTAQTLRNMALAWGDPDRASTWNSQAAPTSVSDWMFWLELLLIPWSQSQWRYMYPHQAWLRITDKAQVRSWRQLPHPRAVPKLHRDQVLPFVIVGTLFTLNDPLPDALDIPPP